MKGPFLVTGGSGFAGGHLLDALVGTGVPLVAWTRPGGRAPARPSDEAPAAIRWAAVDLLEAAAVRAALADARPSCIVHCAGRPHVAESWGRTTTTLEANVLGTHHLLNAVRALGRDVRIVVPSSALVYRPSRAALEEDDPLGPTTPYGLSKLAQEMVALAGHADGLAVIVARPFNHIGPRQDPSFAISSFARQIARAEAGLAGPVIEVGNLDARRDMTDVRDTVRAYRLLAEAGTPGRVYNVCTGEAPAIHTLLDRLLGMARVRMEIRVDETRLRPSDNPVLLGSADRVRRELGWRAELTLERTLSDLLDHWRAAIAAGADSCGSA